MGSAVVLAWHPCTTCPMMREPTVSTLSTVVCCLDSLGYRSSSRSGPELWDLVVCISDAYKKIVDEVSARLTLFPIPCSKQPVPRCGLVALRILSPHLSLFPPPPLFLSRVNHPGLPPDQCSPRSAGWPCVISTQSVHGLQAGFSGRPLCGPSGDRGWGGVWTDEHLYRPPWSRRNHHRHGPRLDSIAARTIFFSRVAFVDVPREERDPKRTQLGICGISAAWFGGYK